MRYGSVCSGIEAATSAWHPLGWTPQWFSEIEPFPSAVLAHHYPTVPNFGDMTKFKEWKLDDSTAIDVLVGGTPCQSFSVAGLRKGLDDPRGNLMLTYLAIARKYRPKWLVWENVPGVLSSAGGEDFASLLRGMGELGYGFAYRVLDAQYFGVAQRRRRVFVVGCLGDWRAAAAVLFERHSLSGHPAPSRKARQSPPGFFESSLAQYRQADVGGTLKASGGVLSGGSETFIKTQWPAEIAPTLNAKYGEKMGLENQHIDGGAGMFTLQPIALAENTIGRQPQNGGNGDGFTVGGPMYTLNATGVHGVAQPYSIMPMNSGKDYKARETDVAQPLMAGGPVGGNQGGDFIVQHLAFAQNTRDEVRLINGDGQIVGALAASPGMKQTSYVAIAYAFDSLSSNSMKSSNPASGVNQVDVSKTLDTSRGLDPSCNQGGIGVVQAVSACDVADTLTVGANQTTSFIGDVVTHPIVLMDQGGSVMNVLEDGTVGTLRRETHGHEPVIIQPIPIHDQATRHGGKRGDKQDGKGNGLGIGAPGDPMNTLTKSDRHAVAVGAFGGDISDTVTVKFAKGAELLQQGAQNGGNCVLQPIAFSGKDYGADASVDLSPTLRAMPHNNSHANGGGQIAVVHGTQDPCVSDIAFAQGRNNSGENVLLQSMAVRRLTPIECERLQGFPDNHTNIPWRKKEQSPDGPRYKALGNSMAVPVMAWIGQRIQLAEDIHTNLKS